MPRKPTTDFERRLDAMMRGELTRRRLLRQGAAGALSVSAIAYLAACGDDELSGGGKDGARRRSPRARSRARSPSRTGRCYIDVDDKTGERPDAPAVPEEVRHEGQVRRGGQRQRRVLRQGPPGVRRRAARAAATCTWSRTGWRAKMKRLGYVQKFDKSAMPNATKNIEDAVASPDFDPKREYSMPWQSGQTALIYRKDLVGGDLTQLQRPLRPEVQGQGHVPLRDARLGGRRAAGRRRDARGGRRSTRS